MSESTRIRIASRDRTLTTDILEPDDKRIEAEMSNTIVGDTKITYQGTRIQKGVGGPEITEWVLRFGTGVSASIIGSWIYDQITGRDVESLEIGGEEVEIDEDSIQTKLEQYLE